MRKIWLQNIEDGRVWNLMPENPQSIYGGCFLYKPKGFGYEQDISESQVDVDYFIDSILSKQSAITGTLYFVNDEHVSNFYRFIGDFSKQFYLCYSPAGSVDPYERIGCYYYKPIIISLLEKDEKNEYGGYDCSVTFHPQSNVWRRDISYKLEDVANVGDALVYPYTYPYQFGGRSVLALEIENSGRETGCAVRITNRGETVLGNVEWFAEHSYRNNYGELIENVQRAKFYTALQPGYSIYVNSDYTRQEATLSMGETSQSVISEQEPSWDYINMCTLRHGQNRFVFILDNYNVDVEFSYGEIREIV